MMEGNRYDNMCFWKKKTNDEDLFREIIMEF